MEGCIRDCGSLVNLTLTKCLHADAIISLHGDDWLRRMRLVVHCEPRGADLVNSAQQSSAKSTDYAALPLAA